MKINIKVKEVTGRLLFLDEIQSKVNNLYSNAIYSGDAELPESENKRLIQDVASILYTFQQLNQRIAYLEEQLRWRPVSDGNLPKEREKVETKTVGGNVTIGYFTKAVAGGQIWYGSNNRITFPAVSWRPIPELEVKGE